MALCWRCPTRGDYAIGLCGSQDPTGEKLLSLPGMAGEDAVWQCSGSGSSFRPLAPRVQQRNKTSRFCCQVSPPCDRLVAVQSRTRQLQCRPWRAGTLAHYCRSSRSRESVAGFGTDARRMVARWARPPTRAKDSLAMTMVANHRALARAKACAGRSMSSISCMLKPL